LFNLHYSVKERTVIIPYDEYIDVLVISGRWIFIIAS